MTELELFPGFSEENFESNSRENGFVYWYASDLYKHLGYETWTAFFKAVNKAITTCMTLGIQVAENFVQVSHIVDGKPTNDYKLSRFACYLVVMNADNKKSAVAKAQAYFASLAGAMQDYIKEVEQVDRINIRDEISGADVTLASTAKQSGVSNYAFFLNAGYRGMYNKSINQLRTIRNIPTGRSPLDFMGRDELAANLFRISQTELKIKKHAIQGQKQLENTATSVGQSVRKTMLEIGGVAPENMKPHEDIRRVKSKLKQKGKTIKAIDKDRKKKYL